MTQLDQLIDHQAELQAAVDSLAHELAILGLALAALSITVLIMIWELRRE